VTIPPSVSTPEECCSPARAIAPAAFTISQIFFEPRLLRNRIVAQLYPRVDALHNNATFRAKDALPQVSSRTPLRRVHCAFFESSNHIPSLTRGQSQQYAAKDTPQEEQGAPFAWRKSKHRVARRQSQHWVAEGVWQETYAHNRHQSSIAYLG